MRIALLVKMVLEIYFLEIAIYTVNFVKIEMYLILLLYKITIINWFLMNNWLI